MKFRARERDLTGCHPDVAEALSKGKEIVCYAPEGGPEQRVWISDYVSNSSRPYRDAGTCYSEVMPVEVKQQVKSASEILRILDGDGYILGGYGNFVHKSKINFYCIMFEACGKEPLPDYTYLPEWLEEVTL